MTIKFEYEKASISISLHAQFIVLALWDPAQGGFSERITIEENKINLLFWHRACLSSYIENVDECMTEIKNRTDKLLKLQAFM